MLSSPSRLIRARARLDELGLPNDLPLLRQHGIALQRTSLGGSHSVVTYPPLDALHSSDPYAAWESLHYGERAHLYVHLPFCETHCTFCPYAVSHYRGEAHHPHKRELVETYMHALRKELRLYAMKLRASDTKIASLYLGGGTPLVLSEKQLVELLRFIRAQFDLLPTAPVCVEGSPITIVESPDKLRALRQEGVTRLSFGIQSFDTNVLHYAARGYQRETAMRACELAHTTFDHWNIDLIRGLRGGNPSSTLRDLDTLKELAQRGVYPRHITWYNGRFGEQPQGDWARTRGKEFESDEEWLLSRMLIWQGLTDLGYQAIDGNRFVLSAEYVDPFKGVRTSFTHDLIGVGNSAYGHTTELFSRNERDLANYLRWMQAEQVAPVTASLAYSTEERLAGHYVVGLRGTSVSPPPRTWQDTEPEIITKQGEQLNKLRELGLIEQGPCDNGRAEWRMTQRGRLFEDELCALFYSSSVQRTITGRRRRLLPRHS